MKIKMYFITIVMFFASFVMFGYSPVKAEISNFYVDNERVVIENDKNIPFTDSVKDGLDAVKSNNNADSSKSSISISFSGIGEISFDYLVSSEESFDSLNIFVNGEAIIRVSGNDGIWSTFKWYNENEEDSTMVVIQYSKDMSTNSYDDCIYLKNISFDENAYAPILNFTLDENTYGLVETVNYTYNGNEGIIEFIDSTEEYEVEVRLNDEVVEMNDNKYVLKSNLLMDNVVKISYFKEGYRERSFSFDYNANLNYVMNENVFYELNKGQFSLFEYNDEVVVKSNNHDKNTSYTLNLSVYGSGELSLDYFVSSRANFDYIIVYVNGIEIARDSGINSTYKNLKYILDSSYYNEVIIKYQKGDNNYPMGDDCIYLKNIQFVYKTYPDFTAIYFNDSFVDNGDRFVIGEENILEIDDYISEISFEIYLNGIKIDDFDKEYSFENLLVDNEIKIVVKQEGRDDKEIVFYLYNDNIQEFENLDFTNDEINPFVVYYFNDERVIRSDIASKNNTNNEISFISKVNGEFSFEYFVSSQLNKDFFIMIVNDNEVLKDSGIKGWIEKSIYLNENDVVRFVYSKDHISYSNDDCIYLKNIRMVSKNYTSIVEGNINGKTFDENTKIIEFDFDNKTSILSFEELNGKEVIVKVGDNVVEINEGVYDLTNLLNYKNVISIEYIKDGYDSKVIEFYYNAKLTNEVDYITNSLFVLSDENVIVLDSNASLYDEKLAFNVSGKGTFSFEYRYFTHNNLNVNVCFDDDCHTLINDDWKRLNYYFNSDKEHVVQIVVNSDYIVEGVDYFNIRNVDFYLNSELVTLIEGNGSEDEFAIDYRELINFLNSFEGTYLEYSFYNETAMSDIYVKSIEGFDFHVNGSKVEILEDVFVMSLNSVGMNFVKITNGTTTIDLYYFNEGLSGSSIVKGLGTLENPYVIETEEQLKDISKGLSFYYVLKENIELTSPWIGIGDNENPFTGSFDGGNKKITGLVTEGQYAAGLFAYVDNAKIQNLVIENATINGGEVIGTLVAVGQNVYVNKVIISTNITSNVNSEDVKAIGSVIGVGYGSEIHFVDVSGSVNVSGDSIQTIVGGAIGLYGSVYDSTISVNVTGNGYVGGVIGYSDEFSEVSNTSISGSVKFNKNSKIMYEDFHLISVGNASLSNVTYTIRGSYSSENDEVNEATLYAVGLEQGEAIEFDNNNFEVSIVLDGDNGLSISDGYVIRFVLNDGKYKYYSMIDKENCYISSDIEIYLDVLDVYENNFNDLEVDTNSLNYEEVEENEKIISKHLSVGVTNSNDLKHLAYVINYGIPTYFNEYYIEGKYNLFTDITFKDNIDLSVGNFIGLGNGYNSAYEGSIYGNDYFINLNINNSNFVTGGFINYAKDEVFVDSVVIKGSIKSYNVSGFVANYEGFGMHLKDVSNYASFIGRTTGLVGFGVNASIKFENCNNYADFNGAVFFNGVIDNIIEFVGENSNYGKYLVGEQKELNQIFVNSIDSSIVLAEEASLNNYYTLDVLESGINVYIGWNKYTSNEDGLIFFKMNDTNPYTINVRTDYLREFGYNLSATFTSELVVPSSIVLGDDFVLHSNSNNSWKADATVYFYDGSEEEIDLDFFIDSIQYNSNELVFNNVNLIHTKYIINERVNLTRESELLENYHNEFDNMTSGSNYREKGLVTKELYRQLKEIYSDNNISEQTIEFYNKYLDDNGINEENLNEWLHVIVDTIEFKDDLSVVYGDEVGNKEVIITYLDGSSEEKVFSFDYDISNINEDVVSLISSEKFIKQNGETFVFDDYVSIDVPFVKRKITSNVDVFEFEYDGSVKKLDIDILNVSSKFADVVEINEIYRLNGVVTEPVNAGHYRINGVFVNEYMEKYYDLSEFISVELIINPKIVELTFNDVSEFEYDGSDKISLISATYVDINDNVISAGFGDLSIINAGEYEVIGISNDVNYSFSEESKCKTVIVNKINLTLSIDDYTINYLENVPSIDIEVVGLSDSDEASYDYEIRINENVFDKESVLGSNVYELFIVLLNHDELNVNYNITLNNGILTVDGNHTVIEISVDSYVYNGKSFDGEFVGLKLYDEDQNVMEDVTFTYTFIKDEENVEDAIDVGSYIVTIMYDGSETHNKASYTFTLNILVLDMEIEIDSYTSIYGDSLRNLTYNVVSGELEDISIANILLFKEEGLEVGSYSITGSYENDNINIEFTDGIYEITRREIIVDINDKVSDYNEELKELDYVVTGRIIYGDNLNIELIKEDGVGVGSYAIIGSYNNSNYSVTFNDGVYIINKATIKNITFNNKIYHYTGSEIEYGVSSDVLSDGNKATITYYIGEEMNASILEIGKYNIKAIIENENYNTLTLNALIEIKKGINTIGYESDVEEVEFNYSNHDYKLKNTTFVDGSSATINYTIVKGNRVLNNIYDAGEYFVYVTIFSDNGKFEDKDIIHRINVLRKNITVDYIYEESYVYNGEAQGPSATASEEIYWVFNTKDGKEPVDAGTYTMVVDSVSGNFKVTNNHFQFVISPTVIKLVDFTNKELEYSNEPLMKKVEIENIYENDARVTLGYYKNDERITDIIDIGVYTVKLEGIFGEDKNNYTLEGSICDIQVKVIPKTIKVIPNEVSSVYLDEDSEIGFTLEPSLYNGDTTSGELVREDGDNVGKYKIYLGSLSAGEKYKLVLDSEDKYYEILPRAVSITYYHNTLVYDGMEKFPSVIVSEGAHIEHDVMIDAGVYSVKVIIDDENYCLPYGYEDLKVTVEKKDISSIVELNEVNYPYNGSKIVPDVNCKEYECSYKYYLNNEEIEEAILVNSYKVRVIIDAKNEKADAYLDFNIVKGKNIMRDVEIKTYYNKIVVEKADDLEYKINNGDYFDVNEFNWLEELNEYTISVRVKEDEQGVASEPNVYVVKTTRNPQKVNDLIDELSDSFDEENLLIVKEINKYMKDTNEEDVDSSKLNKYKDIKEKYKEVIEGYKVDIENSNKIANKIDGSMLMFGFISSLLLMIFALKRKFEII